MEEPLRRFKRIIGKTLSIIIARTRANEFKIKQLYRRSKNKIKLISVFSFKDETSPNTATQNDARICKSIENRAIFKLGFNNAYRI